ncbi:cofactor-independent phosphoglycerate mutase [Candidatus Poribacteria bacterium]|nr:cofactor-independent phosphoglycerate mutase [Candidatus Poribacteria bacterium]
MKYIILVGDGMADYPIDELGGKTPLMAAKTPNMDFIAQNGILGRAITVPEGYPAGSDVANLSIFGYPPQKYYTGRAPLEAASMGVSLEKDETAFRCNLVTIKNNIMHDFTAGHISTEEAKDIILWLQSKFGSKAIKLYPGVSYRHLAILRNISDDLSCTPPHDITDQDITRYMPHGKDAAIILDLMEMSGMYLSDCPINIERIKNKKKPVSMIWLWGQGKETTFPTLKEQFGFTGGVITAVDLIKGIGKKAGLEVIKVPGATGYLDTNYEGKVSAAIKVLGKNNFVFLHVEAPDEASHEGNLKFKIKALEDFDSRIVGPILSGIKKFAPYRILVVADHPTPIKLKTHTGDAVPFAVMGEKINKENFLSYDEKEAEKSKYNVVGENLMKILAEGNLQF